MDFGSFIEGPLLWVVFSIFFTGILARGTFFLVSIFKGRKYKQLNRGFLFTTVGRFFFPLHGAVFKRPVYTILRYIFHICMVVVPVGLPAHILLWESSSLELSWPALPDAAADGMTVFFILLGLGFLVRRIVLPGGRRVSSTFDYIFIIICLLPFLSGYALAHGTLDGVPFFLDNMLTIHILSGCIMIITAVFLFLRSRLNIKKCTGCAACETDCPTGTLESEDKGPRRIFTYSHYLCISCGTCIAVCPESAAELRHEMGPVRFFPVLKKQEIRSVELKICQKCGAFFAPAPQLDRLIETITEEYIHFCPRCKKRNYADTFRKMSAYSR